MTDSTLLSSHPSPRVLHNLRAFARAYRPQQPELEAIHFTTEQGPASVVILKSEVNRGN